MMDRNNLRKLTPKKGPIPIDESYWQDAVVRIVFNFG